MGGYIGSKAVALSTTGADINGDANVDGTLDVSGAVTFSGPFTSLGIDDNATSTAITIDAAGHVGIGAAASVYNFEVSDTDGNGMVYRDLTNGVATWMGGYLSAGMTGTLTNHPYTLWANNAERVRIGETGNVSIGGTPSSWGGAVKALELDGQAADYLAFNSGVSGYLYQNVYFNGTNNVRKNDGFASAYGHVSGEHLFFTGPTGASGTSVTLNERLRISQSGNVGIGTASPAAGYKLDVKNGAFTVGGDYDEGIATNGGGVNLGFDTATGGKITALNPGVAWYPLAIGGQRLELKTNGVERMRIEGDGNVGIGTSSTGVRLVTRGAVNFSVPTLGSGVTGAQATLSENGLHGIYTGISGNGDVWQQVQRNDANTSAYNLLLQPSGGNVLVGTTSSVGGRLRVEAGNGSIATWFYKTSGEDVAATVFQHARSSGGTGATMLYFMNATGGGVGQITSTGSSTSYTTTSDPRLKENITPIEGAVDIVRAMRPCTYNFKSDSADWHDGFLADELQELHPRAVTGSKDAMKDEEYEVTPAVEATFDAEGVELTPAEDAVMGTRSVPDYQGVDYSKLTPILTAALQEALAKIDALTARIETLEAV
jgi:hypothetical protein